MSSLPASAICDRRRGAAERIAVLAWKELSDRYRSGWLIIGVAVWLGAIALTSLFGLVQIGRIGVQGYSRTALSLLNLGQYLIPLMGLLVGQDLWVGEREDRTLQMVLASGVRRGELFAGKFFGGALACSLPLLLGFGLAGAGIGWAAGGAHWGIFARLAVSSMALVLPFVAIGLALSAFSRTRVQSLVLGLLTWGFAVFVVDLLLLGLLIAVHRVQATQEIKTMTGAAHVASAAELHREFSVDPDHPAASHPHRFRRNLFLLILNPIALFRSINLPVSNSPRLPAGWIYAGMGLWLALPLLAGLYKIRGSDM